MGFSCVFDLDEVLSSFSDLFPHLCECFLLRGAGREDYMVGLLKRRMGGVLAPVCGKVRLNRPSEGTSSGGVSYADGFCQPLRAWKNVMAVGHGGEVCVILSEAGCFLMSICHGSLIIHRITDEKAQSQGAIFALCPNSYSLTSKPSPAHVSIEMIFECTVSIFNVHLFSQ